MLDDLYDDYGLSPFGEDYGGVLPDVSNGAPSMQPSTPTGAGTGYYVPSAWESGLFGTIGQALQYAMQRDQAKFAAQNGYAPGAVKLTPTPQAAAQAANSRLLLLGGLGIVAVLLLKKD